MVEIKSVKVDNWGVFFLQKLQNFFNKTDYCDLTLQFQDNSQLKVHRLVLSACTDFFNILEQQCEVNDDILIMPRDLQADVVVPIVNFMYTGTLEFEVNMYGRLLKTARDMSMTVLLKLLEAHKRTVDVPKGAAAKSVQPVVLNKAATTSNRQTYAKQSYSQGVLPQRTYTPRKQAPQQKPKNTPEKKMLQTTQSTYIRKTLPEPVQLVARYANTAKATQKGPSRFDCADDSSLPEHFESSFDNISYESKPLITASQIKEEKDLEDDEPSTSSSFEQLRKGFTGAVKRPLSSPSYGVSPPEKKPNLKDIMEYTEAERIRKEIVAAEEFEGTEYVDDNFSNDDDSGGASAGASSSVAIKEEPNSVNHAKIIHEVLKKYPHLVKNNKNIKLKILQKGNQTTASAVSASKTITTISGSTAKNTATAAAQFSPPSAPAPKAVVAQKQNIIQKVITPPISAPPQAVVAAAPAAAATGQSAPRKIDSKTMHALIAKGAENMTGPWLCLRCGVNGRPISIPSYKSFRRHLVTVHRERIDPKICEHCGLKCQRKDELHHHMLIKHNIKPPADVHFPKCNQCQFVAPHNAALQKHRDEKHAKPKLNTHHCIYCNKTFSNEILVYAHMRNNHKERACEDGVMDFDEDDGMDDVDQYIPNNNEMLGGIGNTSSGSGGLLVSSSQSSVGSGDNKIKILSNISLPTKGISYVIDPSAPTVSSISGTQISSQQQHSSQQLNLEPSSEAEGLSTVASGIATSLAVLDNNDVIEHDDEDEDEEDNYEDETDANMGGGGTDSGGNDLISNQYIETALANVHGEYNLKKEDNEETLTTHFVTDEGSQLELTATQKADLLQQLQDQQNVVMILNEGDTFNDHTQMLSTGGDNQNIVLVYSQASDVDKETSILSDTTPTTSLTDTTSTSAVGAKKSDDDTTIDKESSTSKSAQIDDENKDSEKELKDDDDMDIEPPIYESITKQTDKTDDDKPTAVDDTKSSSNEGNAKKSELNKEKSSLISTLEGDWSEDEIMDTDEITKKPPQPDKDVSSKKQQKDKEITAPMPSQPKAQYSNRRAAAAAISKPNDDDDKDKKSDDKSDDGAKKCTKKSSDSNDENMEKMDTSDNSDEITNKKQIDETKVKESDPLDSKISKNEIKTLINDWGDDDEEEDDEDD